MPSLTKSSLNKVVRQFSEIAFPVTLKDIPGDYGLVIFDPEAQPPIYNQISPSFSTRDQLLIWMQGFVVGWRAARGE